MDFVKKNQDTKFSGAPQKFMTLIWPPVLDALASHGFPSQTGNFCPPMSWRDFNTLPPLEMFMRTLLTMLKC